MNAMCQFEASLYNVPIDYNNESAPDLSSPSAGMALIMTVRLPDLPKDDADGVWEHFTAEYTAAIQQTIEKVPAPLRETTAALLDRIICQFQVFDNGVLLRRTTGLDTPIGVDMTVEVWIDEALTQ